MLSNSPGTAAKKQTTAPRIGGKTSLSTVVKLCECGRPIFVRRPKPLRTLVLRPSQNLYRHGLVQEVRWDPLVPILSDLVGL